MEPRTKGDQKSQSSQGRPAGSPRQPPARYRPAGAPEEAARGWGRVPPKGSEKVTPGAHTRLGRVHVPVSRSWQRAVPSTSGGALRGVLARSQEVRCRLRDTGTIRNPKMKRALEGLSYFKVTVPEQRQIGIFKSRTCHNKEPVPEAWKPVSVRARRPFLIQRHQGSQKAPAGKNSTNSHSARKAPGHRGPEAVPLPEAL